MEVTHCVCVNILLTSLTGYSTVSEVKEKTQCGTYCGLCLPYIDGLLSKEKKL